MPSPIGVLAVPPVPNVVSKLPSALKRVIRLVPKEQKTEMKSRQAFFNLVKTAFGQRRKTLRNACKGLFDPLVLQESIFNKRAEQLSVNDFADLSYRMK